MNKKIAIRVLFVFLIVMTIWEAVYDMDNYGGGPNFWGGILGTAIGAWIVWNISNKFFKKKDIKEEAQNKPGDYKENVEQKLNNTNKGKTLSTILLSGLGILILIIVFNGSDTGDSSIKNLEFPKTEKNASNYEQVDSLYRNTKYGFRIIFPENWEQKDGDGQNILRKASGGNHSINIGVRELPQELKGESFNIKDLFSLEDYAKTTSEAIRKKYPGAKINDYGETKIDNQPAYWISYEASYSVLDLTVNGVMIQYQVLYNNIFYNITIGSSADEFRSVEQTLKKSVSTFVFESPESKGLYERYLKERGDTN